ncbi:MAG: hypothetical protein QGG64_09425 [Candidatus Latescibacteria bacterium]|nr:hypothetical protein [Candidatus Latescibacterota bacterium]
MRYEAIDRLPLVHFGFWSGHTLQKWAGLGHVTMAEADAWADGNEVDAIITERLGFDFNWQTMFAPACRMWPGFKSEVVAEFPDGTKHVRNGHGVVVMQRPGAGSIPAEIDHLLKGRDSWEEHFKHRYVWDERRVTQAVVRRNGQALRFDQGGLEILQEATWDTPYGLNCGSLFGQIRDVLGLENACYLPMDDPELLDEMVQAVGDLSYQCVKYVLEAGARFDFVHFWEDICFRNGPLVSPDLFAEKVGPHYRRVTDLATQYGIDIVSLDCDGCVDTLVPIWLENGVNTMFPIEVGTWKASIDPWREQYGRDLRGVGGVNKNMFSKDRAAVDAEVERINPLVELGGFLPCIDHRIAPDAKWELVRYYCDQMRETFG